MRQGEPIESRLARCEDEVASGAEPFRVVTAMAGGRPESPIALAVLAVDRGWYRRELRHPADHLTTDGQDPDAPTMLHEFAALAVRAEALAE